MTRNNKTSFSPNTIIGPSVVHKKNGTSLTQQNPEKTKHRMHQVGGKNFEAVRTKTVDARFGWHID